MLKINLYDVHFWDIKGNKDIESHVRNWLVGINLDCSDTYDETLVGAFFCCTLELKCLKVLLKSA